MPKTLYNIDFQAARLHGPDGAVIVLPGESHEFTDDEVSVGIAGCWSEQDPRSGLAAEVEFKQQRDSAAEAPDEGEPEQVGESDPNHNPDPAEPEEEA